MKNLEQNFNIVMTTAVLLILAIPVGIANIYLGYIIGESPCTLCWFERIGMCIVGIMGIFMVRYGPKIKYIIATFFSAGYGIYMGARHTSIYFYQDPGTGLGDAMLGGHTYTWAMFVYWAVVLVMSFLLLFIKKDSSLMDDLSEKRNIIKPFSAYTNAVVIVSFILMVSNVAQAFFQNGIPPFSGKGQPERFTMDLSTAPDRWTAAVWKRLLKPSLAGKDVVERAHIAGIQTQENFKFVSNPNDGAIQNLKPALKIKNKKELPFAAAGIFNKGHAGGLAYNHSKKEFAVVSTDAGIYYLDENLEKVTDSAILDKPNGNDIKYSVDSTFSENMLITTAFNKTIWAVEKVDKSKIDPFKEWNVFRKTSGGIMASWYKNRPVVSTVRAKRAYTLSLASDPNSNFMYMISVPNKTTKKVIVIKIDKKDQMLSAESILKPDKNLKLKADRNLDDYYITSIDIKDNKIFALSKNYNTLLIIDTNSMKAIDAYELPQIGDHHAIAIKDSSLFILSREENKDIVYELENPL